MDFLSHNQFNFLTLIPIISLLMLLIGSLAAIFIKPHEFQKTRTYVFISIMATVGVVILAFNVLLTTVNLQEQKVINTAQFTKQAIDQLWLYPNKLLTEKKEARPEFLASLYYNNLVLYNLTKNLKTPATERSELDEQLIAITLIQCWEDYLTLRTLDKTGDVVWLNNFLQWAQSSYLKERFNVLKYNFSGTTIEFGQLLFEYASKLAVPTTDPTSYPDLVQKLLKDPRLSDIFKKRAAS